MKSWAVSASCGTVFDVSTKESLRAKLTDQMGQAAFWDNQEKARQTIQQLKPLNALLNPLADLETKVGDLRALAELTEEDASLEPELDHELGSVKKQLDDFELKAMLSGPQDA